MNRMCILFAEDDPQLATIAIEMMSKKFDKIKVYWKPDGDLALDEFKKRDYDLVISDLQMPNKSGLWLARQIRDSSSKVPIILWTGAATIPVHQEGLFNDILNKDFYLLLECVAKFYKDYGGGKGDA